MMPILKPQPHLFPDDLFGAPDLDGELSFGDEELLTVPGEEEGVWWGVLTKPRQEKRLASELYDQRIPFYLPLVSRRSVMPNQRRVSEVPVFPGYMFIRCDPYQRVEALRTNRVAQMLPVADQALLVKDLLQVHRAVESEMPLTVEERIKAGQKVRIRAGSMKGIEGIVIERRKRIRLLIALTFLGSGVSLELEDAYVEPID